MVKRAYGLVNEPIAMLPTVLEKVSEVWMKPNPDNTLNHHLLIAFVGYGSIYVWKLWKIGPNPTCFHRFLFFGRGGELNKCLFVLTVLCFCESAITCSPTISRLCQRLYFIYLCYTVTFSKMCVRNT